MGDACLVRLFWEFVLVEAVLVEAVLFDRADRPAFALDAFVDAALLVLLSTIETLVFDRNCLSSLIAFNFERQ